MTIETKFDIGAPCFYMEDNKIAQSVVREIIIRVERGNSEHGEMPVTSIRIQAAAGPCRILESDCFRTKEELIASL